VPTWSAVAGERFRHATDATPDVVQKIFPHTYAVGAGFASVVVVEDGLNLKLRLFDRGRRVSRHRHPSMSGFLTEEDARRRASRSRNVF